jgi:hypothetical protein
LNRTLSAKRTIMCPELHLLRSCACLSLLLAISGSGCAGDEADGLGSQEATRYTRDVQPVLERRCVRCHAGFGGAGSYDFLMGRTGFCFLASSGTQHRMAYVVPGDPPRSLVWRKTSSPGPGQDFDRSCGRPMPADQAGPVLGLEALFPTEFAALERWIREGAPRG